MTPGPRPNIIVNGSGGGGGATYNGYVLPGGGGGAGGTAFVNRTYVSGTTQHYHDPVCWESYFAWYPVKIDQKWFWLSRVYRKKSYYDLTNISEPIKFNWIYGTIFDVLKEEQDGINQV